MPWFSFNISDKELYKWQNEIKLFSLEHPLSQVCRKCRGPYTLFALVSKTLLSMGSCSVPCIRRDSKSTTVAERLLASSVASASGQWPFPTPRAGRGLHSVEKRPTPRVERPRDQCSSSHWDGNSLSFGICQWGVDKMQFSREIHRFPKPELPQIQTSAQYEGEWIRTNSSLASYLLYTFCKIKKWLNSQWLWLLVM